GTGTEVLAYFAPYIYRSAITNNRLETREDGHVTFRVKERQRQQWQHRTLPAEAFIRRFLHHVSPKRFSKVRYYGILRPHRRPSLGRIRRLLAASPGQGAAPQRGKTQIPQPLHAGCPAQEQCCKKCGGQLVFLWPLTPPMRGPP